MKSVFYNQLVRIYREIDEIGLTEEIIGKLLTNYEQLIKLEYCVRREGILLLDEFPAKTEDFDGKKYMSFFSELVGDGTAPENIEEIGMMKLISLNLQGYEALLFMMNFKGLLLIQASTGPYAFSRLLKAMLPEVVCNIIEKNEKLESSKNNSLQNRIFHICNSADEKNDSEICVSLERKINNMQDEEVVKMISVVDRIDIVLVMKGLSGNARRRIIECTEEVQRKSLLDDFECTGPVRLVDVEESCERIVEWLK